MDRPHVTLELLAESIENGPPIEDGSPDMMEIGAAQMIFIYLLGKEVTEQLCLSQSTERRFKSARRYLRMDKDQEDTHQHQAERRARMLWLAEALYNLQTIEAFDKLIGDIKSGHVQAAWEEAAFAMLLLQRKVPFRFLHPSTVLGEKTPDLEITANGVTIPCEVEGKEETTEATEKSVYNTLEHGRKQLPNDRPSLICLKIPEIWKGAPAIPAVFKAINKFFFRTDRVVAVVVRSERHSHKLVDPALVGSSALLILRRNHSSKLLSPSVSAALDRIWNPQGGVGGTPLAALGRVLSELNSARAQFLADPHSTNDFRELRKEIISDIRKELAELNPLLQL